MPYVKDKALARARGRRTPAWCFRRAHRLAVGLIALLLLVAGCGSGSSTSPSPDLAVQSSRPFPPATQAQLQAIVNQYMSSTTAPGVVVGIWSPQGTWVSGTGSSDLSTGAPMSADMQYKIASQTKTFTADVVLQLVGEGKVSLNDHLDKWIARIPNGNRVTIRELLNHTSGYADVNNGEESGSPVFDQKMKGEGCTEAELLAPTHPLFSPGTRWRYSNYGLDLLARIAERATGKSLSELIRERITKPLHLTRTYLPATGSGLSTPYMHGYASSKTEPAPADVTSAQASSCGWAAGGMVSTLSDMRVWSVALGTGQLLEPKVWAEAQQNQVPVPTAFTMTLSHNTTTYGLGFWAFAGFIGHQGNGPGYNSATFYSPALHLTVAVADNGTTDATNTPVVPPSATELAQDLAIAATGRSLGLGLAPGQGITPLSDAEIQQLIPQFQQYKQSGG